MKEGAGARSRPTKPRPPERPLVRVERGHVSVAIHHREAFDSVSLWYLGAGERPRLGDRTADLRLTYTQARELATFLKAAAEALECEARLAAQRR